MKLQKSVGGIKEHYKTGGDGPDFYVYSPTPIQEEQKMQSKPRKPQKRKFKGKIFIGALLLAGVSSILVVREMHGTVSIPKDFEEVLDENKDRTLLDEILNQNGNGTKGFELSLQKIKEIEETMVLSEKFHQLDLESHNGILEIPVEEMEFDLETVKEIYEEAFSLSESIKGQYSLVSKETLSYYANLGRYMGAEDALNRYLALNGYSTLQNLNRQVICSKIIETTGLSLDQKKEIAFSDIDALGDPIVISYPSLEEAGKTDTIVVEQNSLFVSPTYDAVSSIYQLQTYATNAKKREHESSLEEYNEERIQALKTAFDLIKTTIYADWSMEGKQLKRIDNKEEIKKKIKK